MKESFRLGRRRICLALVSAFACVGLARGQSASDSLASTNLAERAPDRLLLADALRMAFERNWDLLAARSGVDTATAQLLVAKEFPNPTASWSTFKIGAHESSTTIGNGVWDRSYDTIAAIAQLIEIGGKRRDRQAAARYGVLGAKARFLDAKRSLDQGVTKAYVAAVLAGANARILTESAGYMRHEREIAEARLKAGDIAESDLKQIQVATGQYELQAKSAEAAAIQARIALEVLLGVNRPKGESQLTDSLDEIHLEPPSASPLETTAARPDVLAAETDLRAAKQNLKLQKAMRIPDPTFSVGYEHEPPGGGPPVDTVNLGVSFPLPIWNRNRGNISAAQAALDQSSFALEKIRAQAASDLSDAETAYREASKRLQRYREQIRPQSAAARASVAYKYEKGGATLVDLLEAERTDNDVRIATAQALADTAGAAASLAAARAAVSETELNSAKWQSSK